MASLKLASASISLADRGVSRRANSPSERTYRLSSPLVTQSRSAATYSSPSMTSGLPPNTSVRLVVHAGSAGGTKPPRSSEGDDRTEEHTSQLPSPLQLLFPLFLL